VLAAAAAAGQITPSLWTANDGKETSATRNPERTTGRTKRKEEKGRTELNSQQLDLSVEFAAHPGP
jgi:hypothetical protein